jgi:hypothetical protein
MRNLVCTILSVGVGGCLIGSMCLADTFDAPTIVIAQVDGSFHYVCTFRKGPGDAICGSIGWTAQYNVTPSGSHGDCFCEGVIHEGAVIPINVDGQLIDLESPGGVEAFVGLCDVPSHRASTEILPYQPTVHLDAPNGGEQLLVGLPTTISWTASGGAGAITIDLYVIRDALAGPEILAIGEPNDGAYDWIVTGPGTNIGATPVYSAIFLVVAHDALGVGQDESDAGVSLYDLATETLVALFEAEPVQAGVELRWQLASPERFTGVGVERSESEVGPWTRLALDSHEVDGVTTLTDPTVENGKLYHYQLVGSGFGGQSVTLARVSIRAGVPISDFELSAVGPNPSRGPVGIDYAVSREASVSVTIVDLQGRQVARLSDGILRPGRYHAVWSGELERGGMAPAGVYFIRYQAPGKHLVRRVVMAR